MTTNETKATEVQPTTDDVEGHRIAPFIEDYKDDASGLRRSVEDVEGHVRAPFADEGVEDVEGRNLNL